VACPDVFQAGDILERLTPVCDDLLPAFVERAPSRARTAAHVAVIASGIVLAGGAAYGVVPGELGHHAVHVLDAPAPPQQPRAEIADSYEVGGWSFSSSYGSRDK